VKSFHSKQDAEMLCCIKTSALRIFVHDSDLQKEQQNGGTITRASGFMNWAVET
jgi:hypothetical protein